MKNPHLSPKNLLGLALLTCLYSLATQLGLALTEVTGNASPYWPAAGLALGALYIFGSKVWPAIFLGAFLTDLYNHHSISEGLFISFGTTTAAIVGAKLFHWVERRESFGAHTHTLGVISASAIAAILSALIGTITRCLFKSYAWDEFLSTSITWWVGDLIGGIIFIPLIIALFKTKEKLSWPILMQVPMTLILSWAIFMRAEGITYIFVLFPYLLLCHIFLRNLGIITATILISITAIVSIKSGFGIFQDSNINSYLINLPLFLLSLGVTTLFLMELKQSENLKKTSLILVGSWIISGIIFATFHRIAKHETDHSFEELAKEAEAEIVIQMQKNLALLKGGAGVHAINPQLKFKDWSSYFQHLHFDTTIGGVRGLGIIYDIPIREIPAFEIKQKINGNMHFKYHPVPGNKFSRDRAYIVTYIEPATRNENATGLDVSTEFRRKSAADFSRDHGMMGITKPIKLIQDQKGLAGFLIFYPIYSSGIVPKTVTERRKKHVGWVYSPLICEEFISAALKKNHFKEISYQVSVKSTSEIVTTDQNFQRPKFKREIKREIRFGNETLIIKFRPSLHFKSSDYVVSSLVGFLGSILSIFLGVFIGNLQLIKQKAERLAESMTKDLNESNRQLIEAQSMAQIGSWQFDLVTQDKIWSQEYYKIFEISESGNIESLSHQFRQRIHSSDRNKLDQHIERVRKEGNSYEHKYKLEFEDGRIKYVQEIGKSTLNEAGVPILITGVCQDITDKIKKEHEMERQRILLQTVISNIPDMVFVKDSNTNLSYVLFNKACEEILQVKADEVLGKTDYHIFPNGQADQFTHQDRDVLKSHKSLKIEKQAIQAAQGLRWVKTHKVPTYKPDGSPDLLIGISTDITEEIELQKIIDSERAKSTHTAKLASLGEMSAGIAHEINNPLAIIAGNIPLLKQLKDNPEKFNAKCDAILKSTDRIEKIVNGLRKFSRTSDGSERKHESITQIINEVITLLEGKAKKSFTTIEFDKQTEAVILCDAIEIEQVLVNLISNSIDAVKNLDDKWVKVNTSIAENELIIHIIDSGPGISIEVEEKLFQPFFTTKVVGEGTGLGLPIAKGILDEHKASIKLNRNYANTCFEIRFPLELLDWTI